MDPSARSDSPQPWKVAAVVSFYMSAALVMVFVNKTVLNNAPELPLMFLFLQLVIAVILLRLTARFTHRVEIPDFDWSTAKQLTPVTLVNVIGLVFNIYCLRGVDASFFQIARGLVLPFTIAVSSLETRSLPSWSVVAAATTVSIGFFLGIAPPSFESLSLHALPSLAMRPDTHWLSILYGVLSSLFIAVHSVLIKLSLPHANNSTIQLAYWQNLGSAIFLFPVILLQGEVYGLWWFLHVAGWDKQTFLVGTAVTGLFGFLLCVAGLLSIKVTSPITHMFSSAARSVIQTLLGVLVFQDILTTNRAASILVITSGTVYYTWAKSVGTAPSKPRPSMPQDPENPDKENSSFMKEYGDDRLEDILLERREEDEK
ncbi:uncharacterized protein FIBRA_05251 [Fibroporia radiculosa]|uniref:Sugar phosphate transporter domain-containing protein n=1 Tax=Fibroporia radiculosa TaxID=599839 RepID=J4GQN1_9APHY|nr:uncharacterized protein FIBRA_05251 [Fibroporia radiculosa]CCM03130.1 predicted protein [Fibroporia radiculosa]